MLLNFLVYLISCHVLHQGNVISTPAIKGTILPGITRKSIIDVALSKGFQVNCLSILGLNEMVNYRFVLLRISYTCYYNISALVLIT